MREVLSHLPVRGVEAIKRTWTFNCENYTGRNNVLLYNLIEWNIPAIRNAYYDGFYESCYLIEQEWTEVLVYFVNALNRIIFDLSLNKNQDVALHYDGETVSVKGWLVGLRASWEGKPLSTPEIYNCWYWRDVAHVALLLRDTNLSAKLQTISTEVMFSQIGRYNTINPDGIDFYWHELYLQLMTNNMAKAGQICADMIQKLEQEPATYVKNLAHFADTRQRLSMLTLPYLRTVAAYLSQDEIQFGNALYEALCQHKSFCELPFKKTRQGLSIPNSNISQLFVSMSLLAVCSLAYDQGMRWEVTSDYIPQWLIERDYKYRLATV